MQLIRMICVQSMSNRGIHPGEKRAEQTKTRRGTFQTDPKPFVIDGAPIAGCGGGMWPTLPNPSNSDDGSMRGVKWSSKLTCFEVHEAFT